MHGCKQVKISSPYRRRRAVPLNASTVLAISFALTITGHNTDIRTAVTFHVTILASTYTRSSAESIDTFGTLWLTNTFDFNVTAMTGTVIGSDTVTVRTAVTLWSTCRFIDRHIAFVTGTLVGSDTIRVHTIAYRFTNGAVFMSVAFGTGASIRSSAGGIDAGIFTYRYTVEVLICSVSWVTFEAMCGVVGCVVFFADASVVGTAVGIEAGWFADRGDAGVRSLGVDVVGGVTLALVGGDAAAPVAAGTADWRAFVKLRVVLPAVAAYRVVRPG